MAKSSVITVKLNTLVGGEKHVANLTMEYQELAKAAKIKIEKYTNGMEIVEKFCNFVGLKN